MSFCSSECHRDPAAHIKRPVDKVTDLNWTWSQPTPRRPPNFNVRMGLKLVHDLKVESLERCSTCHR